MICEQLGEEPKADKMPADFEDFPPTVQDAIVIYSILPDVWDGFSGTFFGKDYTILPYLTSKVYIVDDHPLLMEFLLIINSIISKNRAQKQKAEKTKASRNTKGISVKG